MVNIDKIKLLSKEKGLKISYICEKIGASRYRLYDWERGKSSPTENEIRTLADVLGTTIDYLTDKTDEKTQKNKPLTEVRGYSDDAINVLNQIEQLSPANRAKLQELIRLFLADQGNKL